MNLTLLEGSSETGFGALFTNATVGIIIVSGDGIVVNANPFACRLFGYDEESIIGFDISFLVPAHLREQHRSHIHAYFNRPVDRPMGKGIELKAVKKNGTEMYVEISLCSYSTPEETLAVAFVTDITQQKAEAAKLRAYQENLEQLIVERTAALNAALQREKETGQMKSRFVSLAAHEFRTPLSTVLSSAALINRYNDAFGSAPISKHAERIKSAVQNMTGVLNDFLSLDKLEQGIIEVHPEAFDVAGVITTIGEEMEAYLKPGQEIIYTHEGAHEMITDRKITHNVLVNLVSNASKYSPESKSIFINTAVHHNAAVFRVRDEGIGIPATEQALLFSLFYRCSNAGAVQGTGLGLNIVARYVALLGGSISFTSVENEGTEFTVTLPSWTL